MARIDLLPHRHLLSGFCFDVALVAGERATGGWQGSWLSKSFGNSLQDVFLSPSVLQNGNQTVNKLGGPQSNKAVNASSLSNISATKYSK